MNAIDFIRMSLELSQGWVLGLLTEIQDRPLTAPTPIGGNHPLWCVGHLAYSEGNLVHWFIEGRSNPVAEWEDLFGQGTLPLNDASHYPPFDEVLARFQEIRAHTLSVLDGLSDESLDRPSHAPAEMKQWFGTIGQCLCALPIHTTFHGGQIADARRAAGRQPLMG